MKNIFYMQHIYIIIILYKYRKKKKLKIPMRNFVWTDTDDRPHTIYLLYINNVYYKILIYVFMFNSQSI